MTKNELKDLVKECLLEIIVEGTPKKIIENIKDRASNVKEARQQMRPSLDLVYPRGKPSASKPAPGLSQPVRPKHNPSDFRELVGGNDVMASVFADTASSGLVERLGSNDSSSANPVIDTGVDPTLFEGSSNWAPMAFSDSRNSSRR